MASITEELDAERVPGSGPTTRCILCNWLATQTPEDQAEWGANMALRAGVRGHVAIARVLQRRGLQITSFTVNNHRRNHVR